MNNEKSFLIVATRDFKPSVGGVAEYTHNLALSLKNAGHNVLVVSRTVDDSESFDLNAGYKIYRIKNNFFQEIINIKPENRFDYIIVNKCGSDWDKSFILSKLLRSKLCLIAHGLEITDTNNNQLKIKISLKHSNLVICNSSYTQEVVVNKGVKRKKTFILNPGVVADDTYDEKLYRTTIDRYHIDEEKTIILSLCRIVERKGLDTTISALSLIKKPITYIIAGEGPYLNELKKLAKSMQLTNILFIGSVTDEEKKVLYKLCDLYVMPNRILSNNDVEGFGITFLEANLYNKPVIGGRSGGVIDAIEDGKSGYLVDPYSVEDLKEKIAYLIENKKVSKNIGEYGKSRAENYFNWDYLIGKFLEYITK